MLIDTETEKISLFCHIFIGGGISIGGEGGPPRLSLASPIRGWKKNFDLVYNTDATRKFATVDVI